MGVAKNLVKQIQPSKRGTGVTMAVPLPLKNDDRMTRIEFERRYKAMPHLKKAELIEDQV